MILTYTEKNYQYAIVDIIKENELSPDGFLDLTDAEMKEVFHRVGHRKTAQKLIHCIKAGTLSEPSKFQLQPSKLPRAQSLDTDQTMHASEQIFKEHESRRESEPVANVPPKTFIQPSPTIPSILAPIIFDDTENQISVHKFGQPSDQSSEEKVLLLVGATGVGKGTLVNAIGNFLYGIKWQDSRFQITPSTERSQASSQTTWIRMYQFFHQTNFVVPYSVTVIDTPGFADTGGMKADDRIATQLKYLLNRKVSRLDALVLVVKASDARASPTQKYILHTVQHLFGKDIEDNIFVVATHSDSSNVRALDALRESRFPFKKENVFAVNNVALFANSTANNDDDEDEVEINHVIWQRNIRAYERMFQTLQVTKAAGLQQTRASLEEQECLTIVLQNLKIQIHEGVLKVVELKKIKDILARGLQCAEPVQTVTKEQVDNKGVNSKTKALNCLRCRTTCHYPCTAFDTFDLLKRGCSVMAITTDECQDCKIRNRKCSTKDHSLQAFHYEVKTVEKHQSAEDIKRRYKTESDALENIQHELDEIKRKNVRLLAELQVRIERLQEISLSKSPMTLANYIDLLMDAEEQEPSENHQERMEVLSDLRQKADEIMGKSSITAAV